MFFTPQDGILLGVAIVASITDLWRRKIYNSLTYTAVLAGLALHAGMEGWPGLLFSFTGGVASAALFFPAYYWGGMGAGDIKLMAAVGCLKGVWFGLNTALAAALAGGLLAVAVLLWKRRLLITLRNLGVRLAFLAGLSQRAPAPLEEGSSLPFGVAIALGAAAAYFIPWF